MAEPVRVRRLTDQEGQKLQQTVRPGSTNSVRYRRAMMLPASAGGNRVPVIAQLVQADEDTVRDVIHRFNEIGLACLDPRWAGGRPRRLSPDEEDFVIQTATTRPAKLDRIEQVLERFPDRVFAFDEFGLLGIRPTAGSCWAKKNQERARTRSEKGIRWGGAPSTPRPDQPRTAAPERRRGKFRRRTATEGRLRRRTARSPPRRR